MRVNWVPNDSLLKAQWHHAAIGSMHAWNSSTGLPEVKVRGVLGGGAEGWVQRGGCRRMRQEGLRLQIWFKQQQQPPGHLSSLQPPPPVLPRRTVGVPPGQRRAH